MQFQNFNSLKSVMGQSLNFMRPEFCELHFDISLTAKD